MALKVMEIAFYYATSHIYKKVPEINLCKCGSFIKNVLILL